jgi:glycosyltransferase involved in cell wall biosynthesis
MRVLALISDRPTPARSASHVRNAMLWPALRQLGVEVRVLGTSQRAEPDDTRGQGDFWALDRDATPLRAARAFCYSYHQWPRSSGLQRAVRSLVRTWRPTVVHAEELRMAAYLERAAGALTSVTLHNVESELLRRIVGTRFGPLDPVASWLHVSNLERFEGRVLDSVDIAFAYSELDLARWQRLHPRRRAAWAVTRGGTDVRGVSPAAQVPEPSVLFVGSLSYAPNIRGLRWFVDDVLPRLPSEWPVSVAGSGVPADLRAALDRARVRFVDTPDSLAPQYAAHALTIVPLLEGGGTRGKILESLAHGRVVISTTIGAEGLDLPRDAGVVTADGADAFAAAIASWAPAVSQRGEAAARGHAAVAARYDWPLVASDLLAVWTEALTRKSSA